MKSQPSQRQLARHKKKENTKKLSKLRQLKQEEQSLPSESTSARTSPKSQDSKLPTATSLPSSPCTLGVLPSSPPTPSTVHDDRLRAPTLPPPTRSSWTPFSHASVDLNLFARPDFENVCQAVYQSFYIGSLSPNQNPLPVKLPKLGKLTSLDIADAFLPEDMAGERANTVMRSLERLQIHEQEAESGEELSTAESADEKDIHVVKGPASTPARFSAPAFAPIPTPAPAPVPVGSPWSNFVFDPKTEKPKPVSPAPSNWGDKRAVGSPGSPTAPLLEMFSAKVPMTPVRARRGSKFVSTNDNSVHIHKMAYAQDTGKGAQILCKAVINASYTPDVGPQTPGRIVPTLTYVGFEYSDQTCLTYIPIMDTRLLYKGTKKERLFGEEVSMMMKRSVFERIKEISIRVYLEAHPGMRIDCGIVEMHGASITTGVMVKSNRTVKIELEHRTVYRPALETLHLCKHDIPGEALLHVRFSKSADKDLVQLRFILFGIQITRTSANQGLKIFELAESERFDGNGGTGW